MTKGEQQFDEKWDSRYKERVENSHTTPSPETKARLIALEDSQKKLMDKIDDLIETVNNIEISIAGLPEKIFEKGDERYASKTSEKLVYGMVGAILFSVLSSLLYLVLKH